MVNPMQMMQMKEQLQGFSNRHPKAVAFMQAVFGMGIHEGTVIEMTVTQPGEQPITTNLRITQEDLDLLEQIKNMKS